jgi:hypothetical protein
MNAFELFIATYQIVFLALLLLLAIGVGATCTVKFHVSYLTHTTPRSHLAARDRGVPLPLTRKMKLVPCMGCRLAEEDSMERTADEWLLFGRK